MQAVQHQRGLEPYCHWEALPVKQPLHSYLPLSYIPKFYECSCNSADRRHVGFEPVFHSSNTALDSWNERWWDLIWFEPAGGYSALPVENVIARVILLLPPYPRPLLPPGGMTLIGSHAVVCDHENHCCSWTLIPPFLLHCRSVRQLRM